jgi:adenine-specific DNA-methyltransferase
MAHLQFKGKSFVQNHHLLLKYHELIPVKSKSLTDKVSLHDNLIIHGDNLRALNALLPLYASRILKSSERATTASKSKNIC